VGLSLCVMTREPSGRLAAIVELLRPVVDEVVIAVEDSVDPGAAAGLLELADLVRLFPHRDPADSVIPWLHSLCSADWILNLDDDEIPSAALISELPVLVAARDVTHYWLARRWLWPDAAQVLDEPPWGREWVLKLVRNDPACLRFSDEFHRPVVVSGASRYVEAPLWHADFVLRPFEHRREKVLAYEHSRRGMRVDGLALNPAFYLPELSEPRVVEVPEPDRALIAATLTAPAPIVPPQPWQSPARVSTSEIDCLWPDGWRSVGELYRGRVEPLQSIDRLTAGVQQTVDVLVTNESDWVWPGGKDAMPEVRLAYRWHGLDGAGDEQALRTPFPADLAPGQQQVVPVHVVPPNDQGRYRLELDLVHEHERWFEVGFELDVEVVPRRLVALLGEGAELDAELDRMLFEPELEPVVVAPGADLPTQRFGHPHVAGLRDYLSHGMEAASRPRFLLALAWRTRRLVGRARRLRRGEPSAPLDHGAEAFVTLLARCESVILVSRDLDAPLTRELWRLAASARVARALGVPTTVRAGALAGLSRPLDRALARDLTRHAHA
jgi:hypothetical protein